MATTKKATPAAGSTPAASVWQNERFLAGFIVLVTAIALSGTITNDFIINWDDDGYIINNPLIKELSLQGIKNIFTVPHLDNYHPLTTLSNAIELNLFGLTATPFHFFNLLLHLLNTFLVFRFIKLLSGRVEIAAVTALLFGIHPMHVESVAWIAERKDVLYGAFFLGSLIAYLRYLQSGRPGQYAASIALFVCSLLSKPAAVVLAPALLLIDVYRGRKITLRVLLEKLPFFALSLGFGLLALRLQQASGATGLAPHYALAYRPLLACYALVFYIVKLVLPVGLSALHLYPAGNALGWTYYCAPVLLVAVAVLVVRARRYRKELVFGSLFFLVTIGLVIQLVPVGRAITGERYTYIPYIGLFFIVGRLYYGIVHGELLPACRPYATQVLGIACAAIMLMTWTRGSDWKDSHTLFTAAIATDPDNYYGYFARAAGEVLMDEKAQAIADFTEVIRLKPDYADAYYSRGVLKEKTSPADAVADYTTAIRLKPDYDKAYYNRGNLRIMAKDYAGAEADYDAALKYNPRYAEAYCNRGAAKANTGRTAQALEDYNKALDTDPNLANAYYNRGNVELATGDRQKACSDWHKALENGYTDAKAQIDHNCGK